MPPLDFTCEEIDLVKRLRFYRVDADKVTAEIISLVLWIIKFKADGGKMFVGHLDNGNWGVREVGRRCALMDQPAILTVFPIGQQVITTDGI